MNALPVMLGALCVLALAYRYYSAFLAAKVAALDDSRVTPAHTLNDGHNYVPTNKWVLFGHHFAAITGAGPLIGPTLAAQFGFVPGFLWLLIGVVLGGAVHDFIILFASVRRKGKSLAEIARMEIGPVAGATTAVAILFIIVIALAGLGLAVVNALRESSWGTFTIGVTIPLALFMGLYMYRFRKGKIAEGTAIGVVGLIAAVIIGKYIPDSSLGPYLTLNKDEITLAIAIYGFIASVLPVWMLLCPRDYLSSFMKIGTIAFLVLAVLIVNPTLHMPAFTQFVDGGGPIIPGKLFPFVFITVACGAISGFHSLIGSGTTPKMIDKESHIRPIGYGAMLIEGLVGITTITAASALYPADYFAINVEPAKFATLGMEPVNLSQLAREVGEQLEGRTGGAVSLAVGMAQIFTSLPGLKGLMSIWYHFAIMFEALFILTTIDTGTRVARFLVQEFLGKFYKPLERTDWMPGTVISSFLVCAAWSYFIFAGSISTIWPMFGIANQLLAAVALCVGTTVLINTGKLRYVWVTVLPLAFVATTTLTAGWLSILENFWPRGDFQGYLNSILTAIMMSCVFIILGNSLWKWYSVVWRDKTITPAPQPGVGD
ncbi:MAG: carbon starvation protein A [Acidobacteriota bacterium]|nr:carbon starvation protein A [Blastocatellia bacterium]MDW8239814.1 carbon starvation protein A [Acidobacteriota bacterium]